MTSPPAPAAPLLLAAAMLCAGACATTPPVVARPLAPRETREIALGLHNDADFRRELGVSDNPALQRLVEEIGERLGAASRRPRLPWRFALVDVAAPNTFALPGGAVYVTRGILPYLDSEAQLAAVIAHEIGHVAARQIASEYRSVLAGRRGTAGDGFFSPQARLAGGLAGARLDPLFVQNTPDEEARVASLEVRDLAAAGWDPEAVPQVVARLGRLEDESDRRGVPTWAVTHPQPPDGLEMVEGLVQRMKKDRAGEHWRGDVDSYRRLIEGLVYGDDPREGFVRGLEFVHPALGIALEFPQRWAICNGKTGAFASAPDRKAVMVLQSLADDGTPLRDAALRTMGSAGFSLVDGTEATTNGLATFVATYRRMLPGVGEVSMRAAHFVTAGRRITLAGVAAAPLAAALSDAFDATIHSVRQLPREVADAIHPNRIALYTVQPGDTWERIARDHGGVIMPSALAALNGQEAGNAPVAGEQVKIVVPG